jgi:hypothetical protein
MQETAKQSFLSEVSSECNGFIAGSLTADEKVGYVETL